MKKFTFACNSCPEPTKRLVGFMDGYDEKGEMISRPIFDCNSDICQISLLHKKERIEEEQQIAETRKTNYSNRVSAISLRNARGAARLSVYDICQKFKIPTSQYSKYENEKLPIPPETYKEFIKYFEECENKNEWF